MATKSASSRRLPEASFMPPRAKKSKSAAGLDDARSQKTRLWLMYPPKLIKNPEIWEVGHKFNVVTNVRQASVTDEIGVVCLELEGRRNEIKTAIKWLEKMGISVEPVEINVIES